MQAETQERELEKEFGAKTFRFVNNRDLVTRVPPREMFFRHVGQTMFLDGDGVLQKEDDGRNKFPRQLEVDFESLADLPQVIEDHSLDRYLVNLTKYIQAWRRIDEFP